MAAGQTVIVATLNERMTCCNKREGEIKDGGITLEVEINYVPTTNFFSHLVV
jgi:hypothetical protein